MTRAYWECGNSRPFLDIVKELTGKELSGEARVRAIKESVDDKIAREQKECDAAIAEGRDKEECQDDVHLNMVVRFVDGDTLISDSSKAKGGLLGACKEFEMFVDARVAASKA